MSADLHGVARHLGAGPSREPRVHDARPQDARAQDARAQDARAQDSRVRNGDGRPARRRGDALRSPRDGVADRPVLAALDLGTNNCRLLIARPARAGFRVIDAFSRIVRLGQGLSSSGQLSEDAMRRTVNALRVCAAKMERRGVTLARTVATEACRRATNCDDFLTRVADETGIDIEIISNEEEAELALAGCRPLFDPDVPNAIVFDIGGGSTELAWMRGHAPGERRSVEVMSMPVGVVTLAERYGGDRFDAETYRAMIGEVTRLLLDFEARHDISGHILAGTVQMVGTSGTVTTLAGVRLKLPRYVRDRVDGTFLEFDEVETLARDLAAMGFEDRAAHPCIGQERADLVVAGCAILEAICARWPVGRLRVADRGVREGILFGLLDRLQ